MNLFFVVGGPILLVLAILLFITGNKLPVESRKPSYLSAGLCGLIGIVALYLGLV
ncbi:hypothetical protein [Methanobacterium alcaliphilum]|uniref:hypothetical protein n=1 Tax=Methanobacterium alcaliphilum TaxID=392018 RepID=UPI00200A329A|nr:hypothetical protein [Methanobacterium alcaliphilum]MCK9150973.1 hypothetical protein [Methanobacterium alcaliphilum]